MDVEALEQIVAIATFVIAVLLFAAMALAGALADGAALPTLRHRRRHRT